MEDDALLRAGSTDCVIGAQIIQPKMTRIVTITVVLSLVSRITDRNV